MGTCAVQTPVVRGPTVFYILNIKARFYFSFLPIYVAGRWLCLGKAPDNFRGLWHQVLNASNQCERWVCNTHVYTHSKHLKKCFILAPPLGRMLFFNWHCWLGISLNHLPWTLYPAFFDNGKTHVGKVCFVWEAEGISVWAFPDAPSAFADQKICAIRRNQKWGARRGAKDQLWGASQKGWTEEGLGPRNCNYADPYITPRDALSW